MFRLREGRPGGKPTLEDLEEWAAQLAEAIHQIDLNREQFPVWFNGRYRTLREITLRFRAEDETELFDLPGPWEHTFAPPHCSDASAPAPAQSHARTRKSRR